MFRTVLLMAGLAVSLAAQQAAPKIQTLIITGQNRHDWRATTPVLRQMLQDTGKFDVRVVEDFRGAGPEMLAPYDLVILHYDSAGKPELRWGERAETALLNYVRSGKGLVIYHFAIASFLDWDEYEKLCGGNWRPNQGHHSPKQDFEVKIKDSSHPITKGLPAVMPQKADELYANLKWQPAEKIHVLATAWDDHSKYGGKARQPVPGSGLDQPMLWTVDYGGGRIFVTALGHDVPAIQTPAFIETFRRGAEWAATGTVK